MKAALGDVRAVVLFSDEPRQLADWYKKVFALREVVSQPHFIGLRAGGCTLFVQRTSEGHRPGVGGIRPHFTVGDCRAVHGAILAAGGRSLLDVTDTGGEWVAAAQDPHGNPVGLLQPKRR